MTVEQMPRKILIPDTVKDRIDEEELRLRNMALSHAVPIIVASIRAGVTADMNLVIEGAYHYLKTGEIKK